jgi:hypothetical protein
METLRDQCLRIEMWDSANAVAKGMQVGQLWSLVNVKARLDRNNNLEAKIQQGHKQSELKGEQAKDIPELVALLE